jgi:PIN domain nuclease of toxin-antitoxin system
LPGDLHADPADRILIATARLLELSLTTRNRQILAYSQAGFVRALAI